MLNCPLERPQNLSVSWRCILNVSVPNEEALLERALAMSLEAGAEEARAPAAMPDFAQMSEEEQIAFAMQMSMQDAREYPPSQDCVNWLLVTWLMWLLSMVDSL